MDRSVSGTPVLTEEAMEELENDTHTCGVHRIPRSHIRELVGARLQHKLTRGQLALLANVREAQVRAFERGDCNDRALERKLRRALNI